MKLQFTTLDSFTDTRYNGNPVAIISVSHDDSSSLTQSQKQRIASEFNLSEIVFLHLPPSFSPKVRSTFEPRIDIFTSHAEVPFAGHPTIGASFYLLNVLNQDVSGVITKAGPIPISEDFETGEMRAEIPHDFHVHERKFHSILAEGIDHPVASIVKGMSFILVELPSLAILAQAKGNININGDTYDPSALDEGWKQGLVGTMYFVAQGRDEYGRGKYRTRMLATREDPGTGSASCALACYLAGRDGDGSGKFAFEQGVEMGRRNEIFVEVVGSGKGVEKVVLSGRAVVVMEGSLEVPHTESLT